MCKPGGLESPEMSVDVQSQPQGKVGQSTVHSWEVNLATLGFWGEEDPETKASFGP